VELLPSINVKPMPYIATPITHIVFIGMHPTIAPSRLMEQVKSGSLNWLNNKKYLPGKFSWQDGYGAFTYSKSQIDKVVEDVLNQP
jgi:hypothetical protein